MFCWVGNRLLRISMTRVKCVKSTHVSEQRTRAACVKHVCCSNCTIRTRPSDNYFFFKFVGWATDICLSVIALWSASSGPDYRPTLYSLQSYRAPIVGRTPQLVLWLGQPSSIGSSARVTRHGSGRLPPFNREPPESEEDSHPHAVHLYTPRKSFGYSPAPPRPARQEYLFKILLGGQPTFACQ